MSGSDANAGTSAGAAWRTIGKALGAAGIASGDTVYVGAGVYRESVTVNMTSATVETFVIGDTDGAQTGDAGEVVWTTYLSGWHDTASANNLIVMNGRDFLTFKNIHFFSGSSSVVVHILTATSSDIKLDNCVIVSTGAVCISATSAFATALNLTIARCIVLSMTNQNAVTVTLTTGVGSDYDANVQITDSVLWSTAAVAIFVSNSGTSANKGGGVDVARCTIMSGSSAFSTTASQNSTTIPCTIQDCLIFAGTINAGTSGQITDLGGNVTNGVLTNVTAHATTRTSSHRFPAQLVSFAHGWMWGMFPRRTFSPLFAGGLARGTIGTNATDLENRARPEGCGDWADSGTATAGAATTLTDSGKTWKTDEHIGRLVRITGGTGSGQVKHVSSNTATVLTIGGLSGDWATNPSTDSTYVIYDGPAAETDKATSGTTTTFVVSGAAWSVNKWAGYDLKITAGTNSGTTKSIASNTATTLTVSSAFASAIDSTSVGEIFWPGTSLTATQRTPGALEAHDTAEKETTTTDAGGVGNKLEGPGSQTFWIPVDATSTTISVKMRYDANHGSTNKPQAILLANGEVGVTAQTLTMTAAVDTWETLTFTAQTPSAKGVVAVRLVSRSDTPYGKALYDTFAVT